MAKSRKTKSRAKKKSRKKPIARAKASPKKVAAKAKARAKRLPVRGAPPAALLAVAAADPKNTAVNNCVNSLMNQARPGWNENGRMDSDYNYNKHSMLAFL